MRFRQLTAPNREIFPMPYKFVWQLPITKESPSTNNIPTNYQNVLPSQKFKTSKYTTDNNITKISLKLIKENLVYDTT